MIAEGQANVAKARAAAEPRAPSDDRCDHDGSGRRRHRAHVRERQDARSDDGLRSSSATRRARSTRASAASPSTRCGSSPSRPCAISSAAAFIAARRCYEKMLPDQALLAMAYLDAWQTTGDHELAHVARTTLDYVVRDLRGGAQGCVRRLAGRAQLRPGAGSGADRTATFYLWSKDEITHLLGREPRGKVFKHLRDEGRRRQPARARRVALPARDLRRAARRRSRRCSTCGRSAPSRSREFNVIAGWNGLMISALARAGAVARTSRRTSTRRRSAATLVVDEALEREDEDALPHATRASRRWPRTTRCSCRASSISSTPATTCSWLELAIALQQRQDQLFWNASLARYATGTTAPEPVRGLLSESDDETPVRERRRGA